MNIIEALKSLNLYRDLRVSNGNRWLVWDELEDAWLVNGKEYKEYTQRLIVTQDEEEAVKWLLYQEDK